MKRFYLSYFLAFIIFLFFPHSIKAQVEINEINPSGEWVELYKTSQGPLDLAGCVMYFQESKSQKKSLTAEDNFLETDLYKVVFTGDNYLNNSKSDTVFLDCPNFDVGPVVYPDDMGDKSYSRVPDGTGSFIVLAEATQGVANPNPTPVPTMTPTSTPTPTSTQTPTSTPSKTSTPSPTRTPTPNPTKASTPTNTPIPKPSTTGIPLEESSTNSGSVLGIEVTLSSPSPSPKSISSYISENKNKVIAAGFICFGVTLIGGSLYFALKNPKSS